MFAVACGVKYWKRIRASESVSVEDACGVARFSCPLLVQLRCPEEATKPQISRESGVAPTSTSNRPFRTDWISGMRAV